MSAEGDIIMQFLLTLFVGAAAGFLFLKGKIPGGMMVGALVGAVILNIGTDLAYMPSTARMAAQITAGAFIGAAIKKSDVRRMPKLAKPAVILLSGMLVLNLVMGSVIHIVSGLDWITSFFCAVPGGMSDVPIIAADMGANGAAVALTQFFRLVCGVGIFPSIIMLLTRNEVMVEHAPREKEAGAKATPLSVGVTVAVAAVCGIVGKLSGIPVGTLVFAMIGTATLNLTTNRAVVPLWLKRMAQVLSGTYIGSSIGAQELLDLRFLLLPALLLVVAYLVNCFWISWLLHRFCGMARREAMLAATPAGASDMALISGDMGISNPDLNVLQIIRMVTVVLVFPQIIYFIVSLL